MLCLSKLEFLKAHKLFATSIFAFPHLSIPFKTTSWRVFIVSGIREVLFPIKAIIIIHFISTHPLVLISSSWSFDIKALSFKIFSHFFHFWKLLIMLISSNNLALLFSKISSHIFSILKGLATWPPSSEILAKFFF